MGTSSQALLINDSYHGTEMSYALSLHGNGGLRLMDHSNANAGKRPVGQCSLQWSNMEYQRYLGAENMFVFAAVKLMAIILP